MEELIAFAEKNFNKENSEFDYNEDSDTLIVTQNNGKWVFEVFRDINNNIQYVCLNQPLD